MIYFLLILSVVLGAAFGYFFGQEKRIAKHLLVLSAGFLLALTVLEIFPEVFKGGSHSIGVWLLAGVMLQLLLESLTKGFEHGHFHQKEEGNIFPLALSLGMCVHAFIEGIPLSGTQEITPYLEGIFVHNLPISFIMGAFLLGGNFNKKIGLVVITLFSLASPLGMLLGNFINPKYQIYFLAIVSGIFLHISSVIIFESNKEHKLNITKIVFVLLGIFIAYGAHLLHE